MENQLPNNWIFTNLENLFNLIYGKGLPIIDLTNDGFDVYGANGIIGKYKNYLYEKSKVIISCRGAASGAIHKTNPKSFITSNSIVLDEYSDQLINLSFVKYAMKSIDKSSVITGTAQPQITVQLLKNLQFPLAPLSEQTRIVAKLDALFAHTDTLKTKLDRIPQLLKNFRQQVLTQAVTGKLTEDWREGKELEKPVLKNTKNTIEFELLDLSNIPKSWHYSALGNYADCSRGKFTIRPRNDPRYFDGEFPFMQIGDLPKEGGITYQYTKTLNKQGANVSKCFPKDTVVIAIVGATIGNTGVLEKEMYFPDSLIGINAEETVSNYFLEFFLRVVKLKIREISYAGGGQPNIKLPIITNLAIPIPPIEEQREIIKRLEELFHAADAIEAQYQSLKEKIDSLPQAILNKAFKGELVPQDPNDEPASVLLERIRREKGVRK
jgi:type I restriction enzyme S subunit